ncbi:MAG: response regulator [Bacteroidota bacterium]|nr:response regulator [Bacteroidota bacterium]
MGNTGINRKVTDSSARRTDSPGAGAQAFRILIVEDVEADAELIELELRNAQIPLISKRVQTREEFIAEVQAFSPDVVLADYYLPHFSALEALHIVKNTRRDIPFLLVTGSQSEEIAVECIKQGADDYILKERLARLPSALLGAIEKKRTEQEKERAIQALKSSQEQLRALSAHLQSIREEERTRIAREIHDELGQSLTALKMDLLWIQGKIHEAGQRGVKIVDETIKAMTNLIDTTIQTVRRIAQELRPGVLDDLGLIAAIEWQAQEFQHRTNITCRFVSTLREIELDRERSTAAFRILQETLTNIVRHAQATKVSIRLEVEQNIVKLTITDDGRGADTAAIESTSRGAALGILGMKERAVLLGGSVEILSPAEGGKGTTVVVNIPLAPPAKEEQHIYD